VHHKWLDMLKLNNFKKACSSDRNKVPGSVIFGKQMAKDDRREVYQGPWPGSLEVRTHMGRYIRSRWLNALWFMQRHFSSMVARNR
jgi:hypothetical protein